MAVGTATGGAGGTGGGGIFGGNGGSGGAGVGSLTGTGGQGGTGGDDSTWGGAGGSGGNAGGGNTLAPSAINLSFIGIIDETLDVPFPVGHATAGSGGDGGDGRAIGGSGGTGGSRDYANPFDLIDPQVIANILEAALSDEGLDIGDIDITGLANAIIATEAKGGNGGNGSLFGGAGGTGGTGNFSLEPLLDAAGDFVDLPQIISDALQNVLGGALADLPPELVINIAKRLSVQTGGTGGTGGDGTICTPVIMPSLIVTDAASPRLVSSSIGVLIPDGVSARDQGEIIANLPMQ